MVILNLTIIAPGAEVGKKLGDPIQWSEDMTSPSYASTTKAEPKPVPTPMSNLSKTTAGINLNSSVLSSQMTHPIASLSPYQNK